MSNFYLFVILMGAAGRSRAVVLGAMVDGKPMSSREIMGATGLNRNQVYKCLFRCWTRGLVLRTREALYSNERVFKGRAGVSTHTRPYHLYVLKPEGFDELELDGRRFVAFSEEHLDPRGGGGVSKSRRIREFLRENGDRAFFSTEIVEALSGYGVLSRDIMSNVRRFERKGLVYVRGYKSDDGQTPFREGYLLTWLDPGVPRKRAVFEAVERTDAALEGRASSSPVMERVHRVRDVVLEHSKLRKIVSFTYILGRLDCSVDKAERAVVRCLQLYPDIKMLKLFDAYRYYHHASLDEKDLDAAVEMKRNYIRVSKGAANRVGHNWEAVAEWFIDQTTTGASFWSQSHRRGGMDPRRITLYLIKGVGGRRRAAEVDRVWDVTPGVFAPPVTYVLSCKWGLVTKRHVDDFFEVLRWSKEFGVDTPDGRETKNGVVGVFAASAFNPREHVRLKDGARISLAQYAARRNLQLVTAADLNRMLREKGCPKMATVQKICRAARDEAQVRETLDGFWGKPGEATGTLGRLRRDNMDLYRFEEKLEAKEGER